MSQENVEIVRAGFGAWNAGDMDAVSELLAPDVGVGDGVVVRMIRRGVGQGPESILEWTNVCTVRKGSIITIDYFWDHAEALEAVGMSE